MPLVFFILLVLLVAQVGFWHALGAILGAVLMVILLVVLFIAVVLVGILSFIGRFARGPRYERYW